MKVSGPLGHGRELIGSFGEFHDLHLAEERDINQAWTVQQIFCTSWANNLFSCNTHRWTVRPFPHKHLLVHLLCVEAWVFIFPPDIIFLPGIILVLAAKTVAFRQRHLRRHKQLNSTSTGETRQPKDSADGWEPSNHPLKSRAVIFHQRAVLPRPKSEQRDMKNYEDRQQWSKKKVVKRKWGKWR